MTSTRDRWLIALDIDGTVLHEDGSLGEATAAEVDAGRRTSGTR